MNTADNAAGARTRLIIIFFFFSGMTGLIYEILWTRMLINVLGGAPFAVSIILTIFMGGLGLGSYLASRKIDRINCIIILFCITFLHLFFVLFCFAFLLSAWELLSRFYADSM
jgi:spermidine synthase